ncbi:ScbR family autoregulator-binding transcription factor [Streptomyces sp. RerS4]|uniref:ScbR family autoregulator-binding transcription factor n=1 Tax=Streptomyces sp. RerS4 TaxID=2942449 RepID=UPI00201C624B|nr:ScbR family autoregulator-binding transcription factor [Streptomyces sp. RerS4]UQX05434.1 TetR/AcrR family transcriptional regulator [Streptomyces sp. RerS4]
MAQQERGKRSRRSILEAAAQVFDECGYEAASTNEILSRTGLTRGSLYHHFPSKEAIAMALVEAHGQALQLPDRPVKLQAVIDLTLGFAQQLQRDPVLRASARLAIEQTSLPCPPETAYEQSMTAAVELLRQGVEQGEILPGVDIEEAAATIVGSFAGLQTMSKAYTGRADLLERLAAFWRFMLPGLATPGVIGRLRLELPPELAEA